jgi:CheY-like chemotaxis protein
MDDLRRILLVEDDPDIQELAVMSLETVGGFDVTACDDGGAAVDAARRSSPDLIVLDWMMPGMNGGETLAALRRDPVTRAVPIIFMTAKVRPEDVERMRSLGALDVIRKPFDPMDLPQIIRRVWRDWRANGSLGIPGTGATQGG